MHNILHEFEFWPNGTTDYELAAHEHLKNWCLHVFSVAIGLILFKLASYKDMHKILDEF